jgi:hypothetical protein
VTSGIPNYKNADCFGESANIITEDRRYLCINVHSSPGVHGKGAKMANDDRLTGGPTPYREERQKLIERLEAIVPMAKRLDPTVEFFIRLALERLRAREPFTPSDDHDGGS